MATVEPPYVRVGGLAVTAGASVAPGGKVRVGGLAVTAGTSATAGARIRVGGLSVAAGTARTQRMWSNRGGVLVEVKHVYVPVGGVLVDTME